MIFFPPPLGNVTSESVWMNSPSDGSSVNRCTPLPLKTTTSSVAAPYMQYPAATMSLPVRMMSASVASPSFDTRSYTAKIVPVDTLQSMFDEPSSGSKATQKRPASFSGTMIGSSFSSETNTQHEPLFSRAFTKMSFDRTSSFFWSSPLEFWSPAMPNKFAMPAFAHARDVALQANAIWDIKTVSSWSFSVVMRYSVSEWNSLSRSPPEPGVVFEKFAMDSRGSP